MQQLLNLFGLFLRFNLRVMGISCNIIKPKEVAKLHPLINIHDLVGALHLPGDAVMSPPDVNHALAVAAAGKGNICKSGHGTIILLFPIHSSY